MRIIVFIFMLIFAICLDIFMAKTNILPVNPSYSIIPLFFIIIILKYNLKIILKLLNTRTLLFLLLIFILSLVFSLGSKNDPDLMITDIANAAIATLLYLCFYIVFSLSSNQTIKTFFLIALILMGLSVVYDTFWGLNPNNINLRKGGFSGNPNTASSAIKFLGLCTLFFFRKNKLIRNILLLFIFITTFLTFSRSGLYGVILISLLLIINNWKTIFNLSPSSLITSSLKLVLTLSAIYFTLIITSVIIRTQLPEYSQGDLGKRIELLLGNSEGGTIMTSDDQSKFGRANLTKTYIQKFIDYPFGYGTGFTSDASINAKDTHNVFLKYAIDYGFIGLLIVLFYYFFSIKSSIQSNNYFYFTFFILLLSEGFISHLMFVERPIIIGLAFMDSIYYKKENSLKLTQITNF